VTRTKGRDTHGLDSAGPRSESLTAEFRPYTALEHRRKGRTLHPCFELRLSLHCS